MEQKPLELIKNLKLDILKLKHENAKLNKVISDMQQKMLMNSTSVVQLEKEISEKDYEIQERDIEINRLKKENRAFCRKIDELNVTNQVDDVIDLGESESEMEVENPADLLEPMQEMDEHENPNEISRKSLPYTCKACGKGYIHEKRFRTHMQKHTQGNVPQNLPQLKKIPTQRARGNYKCTFPGCNFRNAYFPAFSRHVKVHSDNQYRCDFSNCDYQTPYEKRYNNHMLSKHGYPEAATGSEAFKSAFQNQFSVLGDEFNALVSTSDDRYQQPSMHIKSSHSNHHSSYDWDLRKRKKFILYDENFFVDF